MLRDKDIYIDEWDMQPRQVDHSDCKQDKTPRSNLAAAKLVLAAPAPDVVPDIIKARFLRTARRLAECPSLPSLISSQQAAQIIFRGLMYALTIEPTLRARERLLYGTYEELTPIPEITKFVHTNGARKFMTLADVHTAASRELVGAR